MIAHVLFGAHLARAGFAMLFWVIVICLIIVVMLAVYVPLNRAAKTDSTKPALMRALVAELNEVNADKGIRFSSLDEANAARAEIGRRLLALEALPQLEPAPPRYSQVFAVFALLPILAVPLYLQLGQPEYTDQRLASRIDANPQNGEQEVARLIARVEARLKEQPDDAEGWAVVAPVYFRLGRIDDSLNAFSKAIEFYKGTPVQKSRLMADRAEVMVAKANGKVEPQAAAAFRDALNVDAENQKSMFYLALHLEQTGDVEVARSNWQDLIARYSKASPPWLPLAERQLAGLNNSGSAKPAGTDPDTSGPVGGPSAAQVEAAGQMTADQRTEMIKGMVDGLAEKLKENPQDQAGWIKLINARIVMGDRAQAAADLAQARSLFTTGTASRLELDAAAQSLGL